MKIYEKMVPESSVAGKEIFLGKISVDESMITCPILMIAGEEDKSTPYKIVEKIAEKYGSDFNKYSGHAHWIIEENGWEKVAGDIIQWIKKNVI
jgi:pimeloyl-ACP methyl ester carboxylesterase